MKKHNIAFPSLILACALSAASIPYFPLDTTNAEFDRFVSFVDRAVAGSPDYGFSAVDAMLLYSVTNDPDYADLAEELVEEQVRAAESLSALGQRPEVAYDSYLYVGELISELALVYDWAYDRLIPLQRTRWAAYADQAIYNVWHPDSARWGGTLMTWSGWSIDNPGNNYHYSFLRATMYWAVASQNQALLTFLRNEKIPPLTAYFKDLTGGGSLEGTGYGTSHKGLFELYRFWESVTGNNLADSSAHCLRSIDYWRHATIPTLDYFAPIGDQARVSDAPLYDYQRALVVRALLLNPGTETSHRGKWWLNHISIQRMSSSFNLKDNIFLLPDPEEVPTDLNYFAPVLGDLFARTSWDTNAVWTHFKAGLFTESHAHEDQGSFSIYHNGWQAVTENIHSHSGIVQDGEAHNVIRFMKNTTTVVRQSRNDTEPCSLSYQDDGRILTARADLANVYFRESAIHGWVRKLTFDRSVNTILINDSFSVEPSTISAVWQLNTPTQPVIQGDSILAGDLVITPLDASVQTTLLEWRTVDAAEYYSGWRINLTRTNGEQKFNVRIRVNAPTTWLPAVEMFSPLALRPGLLQVSPNPFLGSTRIRFQGDKARLRVFSLQGRMVRDFGVVSGGVVWDGRDEVGRKVGAGVYLVRMGRGDGFRVDGKVMVIQ